MNELISVIIPIYNAEEYLEETLKSVKKQTYSNIEIILVDDGSVDNSFHVATQFKRNNYDLSIKLYSQKNSGQSSARNFGILKATGKYVVFLDSDDLITPIHIETLYRAVKKDNVQVAISKFTKDISKLDYSTTINTEIVEGKFIDIVEELFSSEYPVISPTVKIYEKNIFNNVLFAEGIIYEDGLFFYELIDCVGKVSLVNCTIYYYRTAKNSTLTSRINKKNFDVIKKNCLTESFFQKKHPESLDHFYKQALNLNDYIAVKCVADKSSDAKQLFFELLVQNRQYSKNLFFRKNIYKSKYIYYIILSFLAIAYKPNKFDKNIRVKKIIKWFSKK